MVLSLKRSRMPKMVDVVVQKPPHLRVFWKVGQPVLHREVRGVHEVSGRGGPSVLEDPTGHVAAKDPHAADVVGFLVAGDLDAQLRQPLRGVHTCPTATDDGDVLNVVEALALVEKTSIDMEIGLDDGDHTQAKYPYPQHSVLAEEVRKCEAPRR